jgi:hypothetical protein
MKLKGSFTTRAEFDVLASDALRALRKQVLNGAGLRDDYYIKDGQIVVDQECWTSHSSIETQVVVADPTDRQMNLMLAFMWIAEELERQEKDKLKNQ